LVDRRFANHPSTGRWVGYKVIAKAAIEAPALDVVSDPIIAAQIADPARVRDLRCGAQAELAVGPWAVDRDRRAELREWRADRSEVARQIGGDAALEFVEDAGGGERPHDHIANCDGCTDPHAQTTNRAFNVLDRQDPRRDAAGADNHGSRDIQRIDLSS